MRPMVLLTRRPHSQTMDLLSSLCDVAIISACGDTTIEFALHTQSADAILIVQPGRIDGAALLASPRLKIVACAFRIPVHIDIAACTRRGIWVSDVLTHEVGCNAELEAARNVLDVISGDTPRSALNEIYPVRAQVLQPTRRSLPPGVAHKHH